MAENVQDSGGGSGSPERPPKVTEAEARFLRNRGPYVGRLAAARTVLAVTRGHKEELGDDFEWALTRAIERQRAAVGELRRFDSAENGRSDQGQTSSEPASALVLVEATHDDEVENDLDGSFVDSDIIKMYLTRIGQYPLLSYEQATELSKAIEVGVLAAEQLELLENSPYAHEQQGLEILARNGEKAKELMINSNLRLVVSMAKRYYGRGMDMLDLIQEGNFGLIRAVEMYDYRTGNKFSTYATWWIRQSITRAMADKSNTIRRPVHVHEVEVKLRGVSSRLMNELGREPTTDELADAMKVSRQKVRHLLDLPKVTVALDYPLGDGDATFGDMLMDVDAIDPVDVIDRNEAHAAILRALDELPEREANVLRMRFGIGCERPMSLREIGEIYGLNVATIRNIQNRAAGMLRHPSRAMRLRDYA